ncbi:GlcG/HbpS family heme-binding protein [Secundilactobacillus kimchicus]|uniref:PduObis protein n=1 Tax=Secundilactobacillus kimchicus JCM 15530 TaxID=1302272 RepID=A0A0R1HL29_9LACO|nr:heme-binding protein [Secundilactobacillus kimchicus]KRK47248.1 pduObis protein [Secundilactobacillus kimchicus JCM 15530]
MNEEHISEIIKGILSETASKDQLFDKQRMEAAINDGIKKADELGVGVTFCFMDAGRVERMLYHMPNANLVSSELAPKKAWSAISMKEPTKDISKDIQPGAPLYQMETMLDGKLVSFPGGIPLTVNGQIIGAVGVSGGLIEEDQAICEATVASFMKEIQ